jgi:hypothetical protein
MAKLLQELSSACAALEKFKAALVARPPEAAPPYQQHSLANAHDPDFESQVKVRLDLLIKLLSS